MFLKRYLILAVGILLFIVFFIGYFDYSHYEVENRFRDARKTFGVENAVLVAASPDSPAKASPDAPAAAPAPAPVNPATAPAAPDSATTPGDASTPPTPAPATPDNSSAPPAPATPDPSTVPPAPDTNAAPMTAPSTMVLPRMSWLPLVEIAATSSTPSPGVQTPAIPAPTAPVSASSASAPETNTAASTPPSTNVNFNPAEPPRAAPVEASVIVLLYHQFVPAGVKIPAKLQWTMNQDVFETEMKYLNDNGYHVVPMADLLRYLHGEIGLPPNSVVITIDDGYKSAIVYAAPILKKYGFPWTFFIYPEFITTTESKGAASWSDLLALQAQGIDIECHSMTHPNLVFHRQKIKGAMQTLSDAEYDQWLTNETSGSKALLEKKMGKPIICFAYPYGAYNKLVEAKAIAAGYEAIFTVADNPVRSTTDMHSLGRYTITQAVEKNFTAYLRQGALGIAEASPAPGATISTPRPIISAVLGYDGNIDVNSIETSVRDFGVVKHTYDPKTSLLQLFLPRDLIQSPVLVNLRVKDANSGKILVANWHFNYDPTGESAPATTATPQAPAAPATNAPPAEAAAPVGASNASPK